MNGVFFAALSCCNQEMEYTVNLWDGKCLVVAGGMGEGEKERKKPNYPPHSDAITAKTTMTSAIDLIREKGKKHRTVS